MAKKTEKKTTLTRESGTTKAGKTEKKNKPVAYVNWEMPYKSSADQSDKVLKSNKGFPIFAEGNYTDAKEMWLARKAEEAGGVLEIQVTMRIVVAKEEFTGDDIDL